MGEFEDLVARARGGDLEALDELQEKFSGSALREQAENARKKAREDHLPDLRLAAFVRASKELDFGGVDLTVSDLGDVDPDDISPALVEQKLEEKRKAGIERRLALAQEAGFATVEEFDAAMERFRTDNEEKRSQAESVGGAAGSGGEPPPPEPPKEPHEAMFEGFDQAKQQGQTDDYAMAEGIHSLLAAQAPVPVEDAE